MDADLALYIISYYPKLMTQEERLAHRHLVTTYKVTGGRSDAAAQDEVRCEHSVRSRWLSDDPAVIRLAADGLEAFRLRVAERILREHREQIFLNYCPQCGGLTRTPKAKLCLHCGHSWHQKAAG
jgi:hypothetical protein